MLKFKGVRVRGTAEQNGSIVQLDDLDIGSFHSSLWKRLNHEFSVGPNLDCIVSRPVDAEILFPSSVIPPSQ